MIYYHMTPERNVSKILREGLIPGCTRAFSSESEREKVGNAIFLARSMDEARLQLDLFGGDEPGTRIHNWAIFKVDLPSTYTLSEDYEGYLYTTTPIPPNRLELVYKDTSWRKQMKEKYGFDYGEIKDED